MRCGEIGRRKSQKSLQKLPQTTKRKCVFFQSNDCASMNSCIRRSNYKTNGNEVDFTDRNQHVQLKTSIEHEILVTVTPQDIRILDSIVRNTWFCTRHILPLLQLHFHTCPWLTCVLKFLYRRK